MKAELLHEKRVTSSQHEQPNHKKNLKPACLAIVQLRPSESRALAWKRVTYLFPTWWVKPQKPPETSVLAIVQLRPSESRALAWKRVTYLFPTWWVKPQKRLKPACLAITRLRPNESRALAWKESHLPLPKMMSQTTKTAWNQRVWQ